MRTASGGGSWLAVRKRRTFAYEARSTSMENVVMRRGLRVEEVVLIDLRVRGTRLFDASTAMTAARDSTDDSARDSTDHPSDVPPDA